MPEVERQNLLRELFHLLYYKAFPIPSPADNIIVVRVLDECGITSSIS